MTEECWTSCLNFKPFPNYGNYGNFVHVKIILVEYYNKLDGFIYNIVWMNTWHKGQQQYGLSLPLPPPPPF